MSEAGRKLESERGFSVICLPNCTRVGTTGRNVELSDSLLLTSELPFANPDHLGPILGYSRYRSISGARVYLVHQSASATGTPVLLEGGDSAYMAFMLAAPFVSHHEGFQLTGYVEQRRASVKVVRDVPGTSHGNARPHGPVSLAQLRETGPLAAAIATCRYHGRIERMLRTFRRACEENDLEVRLHQFVRIVEGFLYSRGASQFAKRTQQLVTGNEGTELKDLYAIRGRIEHLRSGLTDLRGTHAECVWRLEWHAIRAEAIARHILRRCLLMHKLWPFLMTDATIAKFWTLEERERATLLGAPLNLGEVTRDWEIIKPHSDGGLGQFQDEFSNDS